MASLKQKVTDAVSVAKKYWHTPQKGYYVPYKEIASLGLGGFGAHWVMLLSSSLGLNANNFILGACFELKPVDLQVMLIVANLVGIPLGLLRNYIFDNAHLKGGKFLPFLKICAIPTVVLAIAFVWMPYEQMTYIQKAVATEVMFLVMMQFHNFYYDAFYSLQQIISPNSQERVNVLSINQIIYSLAPSISNFAIPTIAGLTYGLADIRTYRLIYPVFTLIGLVFNYIFFRKVRERIVLPKERQSRVRLVDAIREVSKNKYFWILNLAGWLGFLEGASGVVLSWTFVYGNNGEDDFYLGLINILIGNAALFTMILAPFCIAKFGKRKMLIGSNLINVVLLTGLYFFFENPVLMVVMIYLNNFISCFGNIYNPAINADIRDYHQYKTGVRIDSMFGVMGMLGTFIGFFTGLVVPAIYERMGLKDDYSVLFNDEIRINLLSVLILASIVGAILNVIPYLFYDLTELKHRGYVKVLKIRAMFRDYVNNELSEDDLVYGVEIIRTARECENEDIHLVSREKLVNARKLPKKTQEEKDFRREQIKLAKVEIKRIKERNDDIANAPIVLEEMRKFGTPEYIAMLERATLTISDGIGFVYTDLSGYRAEARAMPRATREQREARTQAFTEIRFKKEAAKIILKEFRDGLEEPDMSEIDSLEDTTGKPFITAIQDKMKASAIIKRKSLYDRAVKPYTEAVKLTETARNYTFLGEIEEKYDSIMLEKSSV